MSLLRHYLLSHFNFLVNTLKFSESLNYSYSLVLEVDNNDLDKLTIKKVTFVVFTYIFFMIIKASSPPKNCFVSCKLSSI